MTESSVQSPLETCPEPAQATLLVNELYASIQGESTFAGRPCVFIRLTGCPLRCVWCDTEYAFGGGERIDLNDLIERVGEFKIPLLELTGGEPLAQKACIPLMKRLCDEGYEVLLETSGAIDVAPVDPRVVKIIDVKCPASGEERGNRWENLRILQSHDEIKFVINDRGDYEYALSVVREWNLESRGGILFSPVHGVLEPTDLAAWILEDKLEVRLQVQLHKYLWPSETRGV